MYNAECGVLAELMLGHGFGRMEVEETLDHAKEIAFGGEDPDWEVNNSLGDDRVMFVARGRRAGEGRGGHA